MRLVASELLESREILPGQWLQSFHAPELATGSRAGQFVHVRTGDYSGLVLRRPFSINTADATNGTGGEPEAELADGAEADDGDDAEADGEGEPRA